MTFTYDPTLATDRDRVRFAIQDTVEAAPLLQDEEIAALLTDQGTVLLASIAAVRSLLMRFARVMTTTKGDVRVEAHRVFENYQTLLDDLLGQAETAGTAVPYAGGITVSDALQRANNPDLVDPFFSRRQGDNPPWLLNDRERWR